MKETFREQFELDKEKIQEIWKNAIVVFDTNILLNLYRYNKETCDDLLKYMKTFADRLWMPFQVGWEYHNNRLKVAYTYQNAYSELKKVLEENRKRIEDFFKKFPHHPQLSSKAFLKHYENSEKKLIRYLDDLNDIDNKTFDKDTILETLAELYNGKVGEDYSEDQLTELYKEGDKRYKSKIPPGYKDDTNDKREMGDRHLYGDFIVWRQIIDKSSAEKKDFIFVSDDLKEDWILEIHGKKKGPRKELIKEFYDKTGGNRILIYNQEMFLNYARNNENADIKEDTIKEVATVNLDMKKLSSEYLKSSVLGSYGMEDLSDISQRMSLKSHFENNGILPTIDSSKLLGDNIKLQAENMQSAFEPFIGIPKSIYATEYLTAMRDALSRSSTTPNHSLWIDSKDSNNLNRLMASPLVSIRTKENK